MRRSEQGARVEHAPAGLEIAAGRSHVVAVRRGGEDRNGLPFGAGQLDHHDGIGTRGHRRAGHDSDRLADSYGNGRRRAGRDLAHDAERDR